MFEDRNIEWLLVSDVDDTVVGDDEAWARFVATVTLTPNLAVVLNSSRPTRSVGRTLQTLPVPYEPDGLVGAMGTEIILNGQFDEQWTAHFRDHWDRDVIERIMADLGHPPHPPQMQTPFKASYAVPREPLDEQGRSIAQKKAIEAIEASGVPTRIVCSGHSDFDVLPQNAGKEKATLFLAKRFGIAHDRMIVAGDSGNDLAMFRAAAKGIVVANARAELKDAVDWNHAYQAKKPFADGVLEGLRYWGVPLASPDADAVAELATS